MRSCSESGQAAVEAAVALPLLFAALGLLLQPALLLYDRCVMEHAAAECCRMLETQTAGEAAARAYALRRLGAIPRVAVFHVGGDEGWTFEFDGGELSNDVTVTLTHAVRPLPLVGVSAGLFESVSSDGTLRQSVQAHSSLQPGWACNLEAGPEEWMERWQ